MNFADRWIRRTTVFGALLAFSAMLCAQEPVLTNRTTELRAAPDDSAVLLRVLPEKSVVQQLERKGAWTRVRVAKGADKETGWVRMMHLRGGAVIVESEQTTTGGFFSGFSRLLGARPGSGPRSQNATVGIRGFSEEDLRKAQLNPAEMAKLKRYQAGDADARRLAAQGKLEFRSVAYLAQDAVDGARGGQ